MKNSILIIVAVIILAGVAFFFRSTGEKQEPQTNNSSSGLLVESNSIHAPEQQPGDTVFVPMIVLEVPGYIIIHEDKDGAPGSIIGVSEIIENGPFENATISLSATSKDGKTLYAMLNFVTHNG